MIKTISLLLLSSNELVPENTRRDCLKQATEILRIQQTKAQEMFHAGGDLSTPQDLPNNVIR